VSFYGGFFARFASDAEVRQQEMTFSGIPTGLITAEITDYEVHFSLNLWGLDQPLAVELDPFNWEEFREAVLQGEGIDDRKSWRLVRQAIVSLYKLYGAFLADVYYLSVNPLHEPQLFELSPELGAVWSEELLTQLREIQDRCIAAYLEELRQQAESQAEEQGQLEAAATKERKTQEAIESRCRLWEAAITQHYTLPGHNSSTVYSVNISPDGNQLISGGGDRTIKIWDLKTRKLSRGLPRHIDSVCSIAISTDGQTIVSGSHDNTIKVWDFQSGKLLYDIGQYGAITSLDISADSSIIVSGNSDKTVKVWKRYPLSLIHTLEGHWDWVRSVSISPDNLTLVSSGDDRTVRVWDLKTGYLRQTLTGHSNWVLSVKISPDNHSIISGSHDKTIKIWDLETGELQRTLTGHTNIICSVDISADCRTIVSGSEDKTIKIWDFETGKLIQTLTGHSEAVRSVCISPDSQTIASGSSDRTIKIWQVETPQRPHPRTSER
jgi:WD40 repeat protein